MDCDVKFDGLPNFKQERYYLGSNFHPNPESIFQRIYDEDNEFNFRHNILNIEKNKKKMEPNV